MAGWGLALTISLEAIARIANTLGWRVTIEDYPRSLRFVELFGARIGGEAIDYVTPSAQLGGQFVMAVEVREKLRMPLGWRRWWSRRWRKRSAKFVFISIALVVSLRMIPVAANLYWAIVGGFGLAVALAGGFFFVQIEAAVFASVARRGQVRYCANQHQRKRNPRFRDEADTVLLDFYARNRGRFLASCVCYRGRMESRPARNLYPVCACCISRRRFKTALLVESIGAPDRTRDLSDSGQAGEPGGRQGANSWGMLGYPAGIGFCSGVSAAYQGNGMGLVRAAGHDDPSDGRAAAR